MTSARLLRTSLLAAAVAAGLALGPVAGAVAGQVPGTRGAQTVTGTPEAARPAFYELPATISGAPGTILRSEPAAYALDPLGLSSAIATATKVMYVSRDRLGRPIAVSGMEWRALPSACPARACPRRARSGSWATARAGAPPRPWPSCTRRMPRTCGSRGCSPVPSRPTSRRSAATSTAASSRPSPATAWSGSRPAMTSTSRRRSARRARPTRSGSRARA